MDKDAGVIWVQAGREKSVKAKPGDACGCADVHLSIGHHGRDELVVAEIILPVRSLVGIVEFVGEIGAS